MWAAIALTALVLVGAYDSACARVGNADDRQTGYVQTGDCEEDHMCSYDYAATQQSFQAEFQQNVTVTATVEISCETVGTFNGVLQATRYCMTVKDTLVYMDGVSEEDSDSDSSGTGSGEASETAHSADKLLSGWFCFVQTEEGKVVAIYHSNEDHPSAVNLKKSIAAAFQANFKGTDTEEEVDPQSIHISHYRYESKKDGFMEHRTVNSEDVVDYTSHVPKDDVMLTKEEDIEYKSGKLQHSAGRTSVQLLPGPEKDTERDSLLADVQPNPGEGDRKRRESDEQDDPETYDGSVRIDSPSAEGTYTLDLTRCYRVPRVASRHRRDIKERMKNEFVESTLMAEFNQTLDDLHAMAELRQRIPSVTEALLTLHQNLDETKLADKLQLLLELESKHGTLAGFEPALHDVLSYLEKLQLSEKPEDIHMRTVIYSLLGPEGSFASQKALLHALETVTDEKERNSLSLYIALTTNPHPTFISRLQEILHSNAQKKDSLLLAYGALASKSTAEVQQRAVNFLLDKLTSAEDSDSLVHLIHSLGNSASGLTLDPLLDYANSENLEVQLAAIYALRKHTSNLVVQEAFVTILRNPNVQGDQITTITQTLNAGLEHIKSSGGATNEHSNPELTVALVSAAMKVNNQELHDFVAQYLLNLKSDVGAKYAQALRSKYAEASVHGNNTHARLRRQTSDWDEYNSLYDLVASHSSRVSDVNTYPLHRGYLWGKKFGVSNLNVQFAAGGFAGINPSNAEYKLFGRAVARGYAFGRSATALDAQVLNEKQNNRIRLKLYASVAGFVLVDYDRVWTTCYSETWPLYDSPRYTLLSFSTSVFIYVGTLTFSISVTAELNVDARARVCIDLPADVSATLLPSLTLRAEGSASASLAELVRGGITIAACFTYRLEPEASVHLELYPNPGSRTCINVYDSWPSNYAEIYAWYQIRSVEWCSAWGIPYPCGFEWGSEHRWDALSTTWNLGSRGRTLISGSCYST